MSIAQVTCMVGQPPAGTILLETRGLSKYFGSLKANDGIGLVVRAGEIHAILGENGAGKSTLMKLLYGYYQPTDGEILVGGAPVAVHSPRRGRALGIGMVFQNFTLIPAFRVWENVALFLESLGDRPEESRRPDRQSVATLRVGRRPPGFCPGPPHGGSAKGRDREDPGGRGPDPYFRRTHERPGAPRD